MKQKHAMQSFPKKFTQRRFFQLSLQTIVWLGCGVTEKDVPVLQEVMTGSAQLSLQLYEKGLRVGFPVDHRYGWDLGENDHRKLLDKIYLTMNPYCPISLPTASALDERPVSKFTDCRDTLSVMACRSSHGNRCRSWFCD